MSLGIHVRYQRLSTAELSDLDWRRNSDAQDERRSLQHLASRHNSCSRIAVCSIIKAGSNACPLFDVNGMALVCEMETS
jgi:hypothetical protein